MLKTSKPPTNVKAVLIITVDDKTLVYRVEPLKMFIEVDTQFKEELPAAKLVTELRDILGWEKPEIYERLQHGLVHQSIGDPRRYYHLFEMALTREELQPMIMAGMPLSLVTIPETGDVDDLDPVHLFLYRMHRGQI